MEISKYDENCLVLDNFFESYYFEEQGEKVIVELVKAQDVSSFDFSILRKLRGVKSIEIHCESDLYSSGDMIFYNSDMGTVLAFCLVNSKDITVPDGVNTIGLYAFSDSDVRSVTLPESLIEISAGGFARCRDLSEIVLPERLESIGDYAFYKCTSLKSIKLPEGLEQIGESAFHACRNLKSIDLPKRLEHISPGILMECSSLTEVKFPLNLKKIEICAFSDCFSLKSVDLPKTVCEIDARAFFHCKSLTHIDLHEGIQSIGALAFCDTGLNEVTLPLSLRTIKERSLAGIRKIHAQQYIPDLIEAAMDFPGYRNLHLDSDSFCIEIKGRKFVFPAVMSHTSVISAYPYFETSAKNGSGSVYALYQLGFTPRTRHQAALHAYRLASEADQTCSYSSYEALTQYLAKNLPKMADEAKDEEELVSLLHDIRNIGVSQEMIEKVLEISEENGWVCSAALTLEMSRESQQQSFSL